MHVPIAQSGLATTGVLGVPEPELAVAITALGEKPYRARQVLDWIYRHNAVDFAAMNNLPKALRTRLAESWHVYESTVVADRVASDGTRKLLLRWADGTTSECVLIPDEERRTACISTQVGCPVGCRFCASGIDGLQRQLTAAQIVEQAMRVRALCGDGPRLSNVVFMGLGEPLANYRNTVTALRILNDAHGMHIGARKMTVSTVGLPDAMHRLAEEGLQITLALSLHAPTDELRRELIPWAERVTIAALIEACGYYFAKTGREVTLEYVLLGGVNDSADHARQVAVLCRDMRANVNLIRYNPVAGLPYTRPTSESAQTFLEILRERGVTTHLRRSRGLDIEGACGQLRRRFGEQGADAAQ
ncbi:MAG TPA: 23S rRNA (adenine(2503)-C(2))-methyltransferase RlmN [Phycisphaerae bacterium]|nr:23S rRNA (adenine(2503)-C(2))-methyltransferase RlmN [Phycisphaerales bacterium]HRX84476.1 23S rRNA (adenine(2503)-C(2))-methyltransferase RlmN [Phycisphaerae bacterium]